MNSVLSASSVFQTENLALRNVNLNDRGAREKAVQETLHVKMQRGRSYDQAWFETNEEYPEIFAAMPKPLKFGKTQG